MQAADECYNHGFTFNKTYTEKKLINLNLKNLKKRMISITEFK